jgi:hypothetical protein
MRLHASDDYPFHQHPPPLGIPATTDSKFNDGYWFSFYGPEWSFVSVLRLHPNVNAIGLGGAAGVALYRRAASEMRPARRVAVVGGAG